MAKKFPHLAKINLKIQEAAQSPKKYKFKERILRIEQFK